MRPRWRQYANDHPRAVDAAMIVLLLCAVSGQANLNSNLPGADALGWWSAGPLAIAASLALLWRREFPGVVVVFTALCVAAEAGVGYLITPVNLAPAMVALYELAVRVSATTARRYYLGATVLIVLTAVLGNRFDYPWPLAILNPVLFLLLPVALGATTRLRNSHLEEESRHRVSEERMRIARELHDVVAHHLALANAQAGTAAYLSRSHPDKVHQILTELTNTTSSALREMKATVGLLRQPTDTESPLDPTPSLAQLSTLTTKLESTGLAVGVTTRGKEQPLTPEADLAAYRIIQEALTNVSKHTTTTTAHITLAYGNEKLTITISNKGEITPPVIPGFGLIGMRERAMSAGGTLQATPNPTGGFTVTTELPTT